ncbi:type-F conjugative transfer system pilin assembly protein TrbC [Rubrivivax sp. A210]|uniref:type-F conjugative transfer system pilin assembly protein TrbC n=1 Tax=Rubrivivax sp. A210 TaxID=2772301 RepID=UPI00191B68FE|nr:type-F conjugative transfer system pilin assembly protein TrbC [Rubrivivax sp. A210]
MRLPDAAELEAARRLLPSPADLERATREQQRSSGVRPPSAESGPGAGVDLSRLAEQYEQMRRGPAAESGADRVAAGLLIFVSLGMPTPSLERLVADAERVRATLVLRGVKEMSLKKTAAAITEVMGQRRVAWQIDPMLYRRFEVGAVPSFVLIDPARPMLVACGQSQCQGSAYAKLAGDVSIDHALAEIERGDADLAEVARRTRDRLLVMGGRP